jgi:hypothetical protein
MVSPSPQTRNSLLSVHADVLCVILCTLHMNTRRRLSSIEFNRTELTELKQYTKKSFFRHNNTILIPGQASSLFSSQCATVICAVTPVPGLRCLLPQSLSGVRMHARAHTNTQKSKSEISHDQPITWSAMSCGLGWVGMCQVPQPRFKREALPATFAELM